MITYSQILQEIRLNDNVKYLIPVATALAGGYLANHAYNHSAMEDYIAQNNANIDNKETPEKYYPSTIGNVLSSGGGALSGMALGAGALGYKLSKEQNKNNLSNILK